MTTHQIDSESMPPISLMSKRTRYEMFRSLVVKKHGLAGAPEEEIERMVRIEIELLVSKRARK